MKILITGHTGFIGKYLRNALEKQNHELIYASKSSGIDVCDWNQIKNIEDVDAIFHLANLSFVPYSYENPLEFYRTNYLSTLNVLELCRIHNAKCVFLSSYIYGAPIYQPIDEEHPTVAFNPYAQTKKICESLCEGYNRDFNVSVDIFRPFNIYGKGQNHNFLIPSIIEQAKEGKIIVKDERPKRDYIHVNDVVSALVTSVHRIGETKGRLNIYNLGSGNSYSVKEIANIIISLIGTDISYEFTDERRPNEILDTKADISKIKKELNWEPKVKLEDGLKSMI